MKIVLITPGQPSLNPRIVKEADAFSVAGHEVFLLYCHWISWADKTDQSIVITSTWKAILVGGSPSTNQFSYFFTKIFYKSFRLLSKYGICKWSIAEKAQARCYALLLEKAKGLKADYYIGHNLGALAVAVNAAAATDARCGFDFEDYHRGEADKMPVSYRKRIAYLEKKYISACDHLSFASPLIAKKELSHFPGFRGRTTIIHNCFPFNKSISIAGSSEKLKLFWFSQTVGADRGLVTVLLAMRLLADERITLTLVGNTSDTILKEFQGILGDLSAQLIIKGVVSPGLLDKLAAQADVGLALEQSIPMNRDICLTNKIFTYLSAGLAIIFSDTTAQTEFNRTYQAGITYPQGNAEALASCIQQYLNPEFLQAQKIHNYNLAKEKLNWEQESNKLLEIIS